MGYRYYLGAIDKDTIEELESLTLEQAREQYGDDDGIFNCIDLVRGHGTGIYELGKYPNRNVDALKRPINNEEVSKYLNEDNDFWILSKEGLVAIMEQYRKDASDYMQKILDSDDKEEMAKRLKSEIMEINYKDFYNLDFNEPITGSWKFNYCIFELVRIYREFDWENNHLILYAY